MSLTAHTTLLATGLLLLSTNVLADEVVIAYRSGKVQQVTLQEPTEQILQISYRKATPGNDTVTQQPQTKPPAPPTAESQPKPTEKSGAASASPPKTEAGENKRPVKFKWAQPRDE